MSKSYDVPRHFDDLRVKVEALFNDNKPPYIWSANEDVLFPGMSTIKTNEAIRDVWESAKEQVLRLIDHEAEEDR